MARLVGAVRPRLARAAAAAGPWVARLTEAAEPQLTRATRTWQYTALAATAGLALAVAAVTAAGPWDSSGQRTAERDRATARGSTGGVDHGAGSAGREPSPAPSAASVLTGLGSGTPGHAVPAAPGGKAFADVLGPLLKDPSLGPRRSAAVVDISTGKRLYAVAAGTALTPASTTKIATAVAALSALGPDHRLTTRTALETGTKELVLVGGGDPTLTARAEADGNASLRTLADRTAAALRKRGLRKVTLSYDTTLYAGRALHPIGVNDNLAAVTALMADEARTNDSVRGPVPRVPDPAADAARRFGDFLQDHGITTSAPGPSEATGHADALAAVSSPPLASLVERMLTNSDNDIAEALARHTAVATGKRADLAGAGAAIRSRLDRLGLPVSGARIKDGSGLDRTGHLTADLLTALLVTAADPGHPELRPTLTGLPVAGFTGTLSSRYADGAAGLVRAKTGTLTGVNTLAGTVVAHDGRILAFAFLTTGTKNPGAAQAALDRAATALASCGCR